MSETIYRVLHIFESDYGCEEHSEPMVDVVLESPDGRRSTIPYSDARLYALDIFQRDPAPGTAEKGAFPGRKRMTEVEVQQRAKRYLDCLVQGINPLDGTVIPEGDTVRQVRIARCLQYVSGILEQVIENHGEVQRVKKKRSERLPFSLTPEQLLSLKPEPQPVSISEIVQKCNAMIDEYTMCRLKTTTLTKWLVRAGFLEEISVGENRHRKIPTANGTALGIAEKTVQSFDRTYTVVTYSSRAQEFLFENLEMMLEEND